jgi:predicted MFS family arabinose efflux permease
VHGYRCRAVRKPHPSVVASLALAAIFAVVMAATTVSTPLYPAYADQFGLTPLTITVVFAVYGVGVMGGLAVTGRLSDHVGRKPPLAAGLVLGLVAMVIFIATHGLGLLLAGRLLIGVTAGLYTGTATAWLVDLGADRARATKLAVGANLGGLALGPALAGLLAQFAPHPLRTVYVVELVLMAAGLVAHALLPETVPRRGFDLDFAGIVPPREVRAVFLPAATAGVAAFGVSGVFGSVGPGMLREVLGITAPTASGALVATLFVMSVVGQGVARRFAPAVALPAGCVALAASLVLLGLALALETVVALVASAVVGGLAQGVIVGAGLGLLTARAPAERRSQVASTYFLVLYIGLVVPVVAFGVVEASIGLVDAGYVFCAVVGAAALLSGVAVRRGGAADPAPASL